MPSTVTGLPTWFPPVVQSGGVAAGPHSKNVTVPRGTPEPPVSVAVSVTESPGEMLEGVAWVTMVGGPATAPDLSDRSWLPPLPSVSSVRVW